MTWEGFFSVILDKKNNLTLAGAYLTRFLIASIPHFSHINLVKKMSFKTRFSYKLKSKF